MDFSWWLVCSLLSSPYGQNHFVTYSLLTPWLGLIKNTLSIKSCVPDITITENRNRNGGNMVQTKLHSMAHSQFHHYFLMEEPFMLLPLFLREVSWTGMGSLCIIWVGRGPGPGPVLTIHHSEEPPYSSWPLLLSPPLHAVGFSISEVLYLPNFAFLCPRRHDTFQISAEPAQKNEDFPLGFSFSEHSL